MWGVTLTNPNVRAQRALEIITDPLGHGSAAVSGAIHKLPGHLGGQTPEARAFKMFAGYLEGFFDTGSGITNPPGPNDPQLNYQWAAYIPGIIEDHEYISAITTPTVRYDQQSRFLNGKMQHYPGFLSIDDISMTLYTESRGLAMSALTKWVRSVRAKDGIYSLPKDYKRTVVVALVDASGRVVAEMHYLRCWPISWNSYDLNYGDATLLATQISLSVDDVEFSTPGYNELGG